MKIMVMKKVKNKNKGEEGDEADDQDCYSKKNQNKHSEVG
jgi:hypothetical protein